MLIVCELNGLWVPVNVEADFYDELCMFDQLYNLVYMNVTVAVLTL